MRKVNLISLFLIAAMSQTIDIKGQIQKIDSNRFGKTLLDTVYLQLQTQEPIERLLGTLQQLEDRYNSDQKEDDSIHKDFQDACTLDLTQIDNSISISDNERVVLEAKLEGELYPKQDIIQKLINYKTGESKQLGRELNELDDQRQEEALEHEQTIREHEEVREILNEAKSIFSQNLQNDSGESAFIERWNIGLQNPVKLSGTGIQLLQKHFSTSIKTASKFTKRKSWGKLFKTLATITTRVEALGDPSQILNIVGLIDQLQDKVAESMSLERFSEDKRIQAYEKARNLMIISINVTNTALANAQSDLQVIQEIIAQTQATLENTNQRLEILEEQRLDRFNTCELEAQDYQESRIRRDEDRNVVSQTLGLLNQQLRGLKEQLALRMQAGDTFEY